MPDTDIVDQAEEEAHINCQTTWASRNPTLDVQPMRTRAKLSTAKRNTQQLGHAARNLKNTELATDMDALNLTRTAEIEVLALKHHRKSTYIRDLITTSTHYKSTCGPTLHNALAHHKAVELNKGKDASDRLTLKELQELMSNDPELQDLSLERQVELKATLMEHRAQKKVGARPSNRSAALDFRSTVASVNRELEHLSECTGSYAITFFTCGHVDDNAAPEWLASGDSMDFLSESLGLDPWDVTRLFEQWACTRSKTLRKRDTLASMRAECTKLILSGLKFASKTKKVAMNYTNYEEAIITNLRVKIVGWTFSRLVSPSEIGTVDDIRKLRDALKTGACKWVRLSKHELAEHVEDISKRHLDGEIIGKKRKERSDKGLKRKSCKVRGKEGQESDEDIAGPSKKKRRVASKSTPARPSSPP